MTMAKIRFEHARKEFLVRGKDGGPAQSFTALDDVTLDVRAGEFLALVPGRAAAASRPCWICSAD